MTLPSYNDIESTHQLPPYPIRELKYRSYKDGECKTFDTWTEANSFSKLIEKFQCNKKEYDEQLERYNEINTKIYNEWKKQLYEYFSKYPIEIIDLLYEYAVEDTDHSDYEGIGIHMKKYARFMEETNTVFMMNK